ncbi:hypothetical protein PTKIN_Ptkin11bG0191600 [Pterospermum kingtungense]
MSSANFCTATSLRTIEAAIGEIDAKKDELKKAFDNLQAHSSHLSSFSISWSDVDSYFASIQDSIIQRFHDLQSANSAHNHAVEGMPVLELTLGTTQLSKQGDPSTSKPRQVQIDPVSESVEQPSSSNSVRLHFGGSTPPPGSSRIDSVVARPELKELCERMDGKGLRKYINEHVKERDAIRMELPSALRSAPDPGALVLYAMEGFYAENSQSKGEKDPELFGLRRVCMFLLEQLMETGVNFSEEVRERAKKVALEWKARVRMRKDNSLETLAFLHLVATYGLGAEVDKDELVVFFFNAARYREATMLCRSICLGEKVHDLIQKLLANGKQLLALRFVFEFGLAKKFPPVPLLEDYLKETKRLAEQVCKDGKNSLRSQNEATAKEIGALRSVIKIIEQHKLENEYSKENLQKRIEQLEKQQSERKNRATAPAAKPQQQLAIHQASHQAKKKKKQAQGKQQQSGNKRAKTTASVIHTGASLGAAGSSSAVPPFQQAHLHPAGILPDQSASFLSPPAGPYGIAGSAVNPYAGPSAAIFGAPAGFSVNPNPAVSQLYPYDRLPTYGAYGLPPQYHPSYHPR